MMHVSLLMVLLACLLTLTEAQTLQQHTTVATLARRLTAGSHKTCPETILNTTWYMMLSTTCPINASQAFSSDAWKQAKEHFPNYETDAKKLAAYAVNSKPIPWSKYVLSISMNEERRMALKTWLDSTEAAYPGLLDALCEPGPCQKLVPDKDCLEDLIENYEKDQSFIGYDDLNTANFTRILSFLQMFDLCRARVLYSDYTTTEAPSESVYGTDANVNILLESSSPLPSTSSAPDNTTRWSPDAAPTYAQVSETHSAQMGLAFLCSFASHVIFWCF
jgi:hypothetical protein